MSELADLNAARQRSARRRAEGVATDFDPSRLTLARRLVGMPRAKLARLIEVTPAAITQYEKGLARPTLPVLEALAVATDVPVDFMRCGQSIPMLAGDWAHFRSLRSCTALDREQALSFGELVLQVFAALEEHVDFPQVSLPQLSAPDDLTGKAIPQLARQARDGLGVEPGPAPNVVRLLEAAGVLVVYLDKELSRVDAFSHEAFGRPLVLLSPAKEDKARSRFDAAHELGHLLMHHDTAPGSKIVEQQAHSFAAEFLMPADEIIDELPRRLDWPALHALKRRWGVSLKALIFRAKTLEVFSDYTYQRGMRELATWGYPEPGALGEPERPVLIPRAMELLGADAVRRLAGQAGLPEATIERIARAGGGSTESKVLLRLGGDE